jgi:hypothetical protein
MTNLLKYIQKRQIGHQKFLNQYIRYLKYFPFMCNEDHKYGYAPHIHNKRCKFCCGDKPITLTEYVKNIHKKYK